MNHEKQPEYKDSGEVPLSFSVSFSGSFPKT